MGIKRSEPGKGISWGGLMKKNRKRAQIWVVTLEENGVVEVG